jgi:hypothetical protein
VREVAFDFADGHGARESRDIPGFLSFFARVSSISLP